MTIRQAWIAVALAMLSLTAFAFDRPFPPGTKRGKMTPEIYPAIVLDGKARTLSAGARIWNADNLIQMPASLGNREYVVNYTETAEGQIDRVWILTPAEARVPASSVPQKSVTQ